MEQMIEEKLKKLEEPKFDLSGVSEEKQKELVKLIKAKKDLIKQFKDFQTHKTHMFPGPSSMKPSMMTSKVKNKSMMYQLKKIKKANSKNSYGLFQDHDEFNQSYKFAKMVPNAHKISSSSKKIKYSVPYPKPVDLSKTGIIG